MKILMYCLLALNVGVWLMYGIDKWKAKFVISVPIFFVIHCVIAGYVLLNY
ncbi:hypothetical protein [[Ruminococcus] torques]|uniref:hypothetical protein n=1 Tax=[Ruminococcus] torques TaxID=33039 RepID=UPI003AB59044